MTPLGATSSPKTITKATEEEIDKGDKTIEAKREQEEETEKMVTSQRRNHMSLNNLNKDQEEEITETIITMATGMRKVEEEDEEEEEADTDQIIKDGKGNKIEIIETTIEDLIITTKRETINYLLTRKRR